ncbi:hypothetical protein ACQPZG_14920 [Streptomyces sp. CA-294286]|uniref:hypothetical protein n=1 Tax=Streptomyces sp. CA-294286 TaxID=3240070 RepID=UPI003D91CE84
MTRVPVHRYQEVDGNPHTETDGWFDREQVEASFSEASSEEGPAGRRKSGRSRVEKAVVESLHRTGEGRWVLETRLADRAMAGRVSRGDRCRFLTDMEAVDWLTRNRHEEAVRRWLPGLPDEVERGPGRPPIGGRVQVRLGELLPGVDRFAEENAYSRAEAVRALVRIGLRRGGAAGPHTV